jgi:gamma-glutamyltranspeptidase/glutathione hydrolase
MMILILLIRRSAFTITSLKASQNHGPQKQSDRIAKEKYEQDSPRTTWKLLGIWPILQDVWRYSVQQIVCFFMINSLDNRFLDRHQQRDIPEFWMDAFNSGCVVSAHYRASDAGVQILNRGGNAIDAAVAVSAALGVVEPAGSGLGGMTMMLLHLANSQKTVLLEGPCRAPHLATPRAVAVYPRKSGYKAIAVPTNPAVLAYVLKNYGSMSADEVLEPAIELAEDGYLQSPFQHKVLDTHVGQLSKHNGARFFLNDHGKAFSAGERFEQPILAKTLKRLAQFGFEEFYLGETGQQILKDMQENNGFLSAQDLDPIPYPEESESFCKSMLDWRVYTTPPPGGGIALLEMLLLFEQLAPKEFDPNSPEAAVLYASIIHKVRNDRIQYRLDLTKHGKALTEMLALPHIHKAATTIHDDLAGSGETTHFNVIDKQGNIVACTQSIERSYGAKVVTPSLGFLYNGFMKGFKIENKRHPHYLRPGAVARSNAAPTLIFAPDKIYAIGSTGSERLASGIFQVLLRLRHQHVFNAVSAPRLHCTPRKQVQLEIDRFSEAQRRALRHAGFALAPYAEAWAFSAGGLHLACCEKITRWAVADPRRDGAALGY